ncbi:unnamed protein product [Microthlaspi erraticum]|uniref:Uncharacterized protein n=1 Tax=Microthlaspi erraticum TaxID=1685480 RepID=A0A6D2JFD6_9BRAS|nr:unnamed protein product [Microthlaspi erraticum]
MRISQDKEVRKMFSRKGTFHSGIDLSEMRRIKLMPCDQESSSFYSSEVDRNLLRVSRPRATTDPAISGSERSKRDSRLTRSNSACGLDSVELELDFVFTSSSDSKQLDFGQGYFGGLEVILLGLSGLILTLGLR